MLRRAAVTSQLWWRLRRPVARHAHHHIRRHARLPPQQQHLVAGRQIRSYLLGSIGHHASNTSAIHQTLHQLGAFGQRQHIDNVLVLVVDGRMLQMGAQFDQRVRVPQRLRRRRERNVLANGTSDGAHRSTVAGGRFAIGQRRLRMQSRYGAITFTRHRDHRRRHNRMLCRTGTGTTAVATVRHQRRRGRRLGGQRCVERELFAGVEVVVLMMVVLMGLIVMLVMMIVTASRTAAATAAGRSGGDVMMRVTVMRADVMVRVE